MDHVYHQLQFRDLTDRKGYSILISLSHVRENKKKKKDKVWNKANAGLKPILSVVNHGEFVGNSIVLSLILSYEIVFGAQKEPLSRFSYLSQE